MRIARGEPIAPRACRCASIVLTTLSCVSCAPRLMKLPAGLGVPAADAATAIAEATNSCRAVTTLTAEIGVSGSVAGRRLRGRLLAGLAPPASARLEAVAPFGQPLFIFVARGDAATLLLPRDNRVLEHARAEAVLEAVTGVPLDAAGLRAALTGCAIAPDGSLARQIGDDWRVVPDGPTDVYLHRASRTTPWRVVADVHRERAGHPGQAGGEWRAEYRDFQDGLPRTVRLTSISDPRFDLRLTLSQVETGTSLAADAFTVQIPPSVEPITLAELRRSGPLSSKSDAK
jgi:hypothetical protein